MRIGINLLYLLPGVVGGTETYALSLLQALGQIDQQNEYIVFLNSESVGLELPSQANFEAVVCPVRARSRIARYLWEQSVLPLQARRHHLDLLHSLGYVKPLRLPCKSVVTIHDLNFYNIGHLMSSKKRVVLRYFVPRSARSADHIITVSEFSKKQILEFLGVSPERVTVTYNAVKEGPAAPADLSELTQSYDITQPYILGLSSPSPHKNIVGLVKAFELLKREGCGDLSLVLAGHRPVDRGELDQVIRDSEFRKDIVFTGYVPDSVLASIYAHAEAFVFPSTYEGFGIPILEAFSYGTPVASSNAASLPEIGGDAVLYFDPRNIEEMAGVIIRSLQDEGLRNTLVAKGKERIKGFTWEKSARETLEVYNKIIGGNSL